MITTPSGGGDGCACWSSCCFSSDGIGKSDIKLHFAPSGGLQNQKKKTEAGRTALLGTNIFFVELRYASTQWS